MSKSLLSQICVYKQSKQQFWFLSSCLNSDKNDKVQFCKQLQTAEQNVTTRKRQVKHTYLTLQRSKPEKMSFSPPSADLFFFSSSILNKMQGFSSP